MALTTGEHSKRTAWTCLKQEAQACGTCAVAWTESELNHRCSACGTFASALVVEVSALRWE